MLYITRLASVINEKLEIDPYIPLKIQWGQWKLAEEPTIYWRTGDFKSSLIEIGIAANSGLIRSFTFVHSKDISFTDLQTEWPKLYIEGTPIFDISKWPDSGRLDEQGLARICLYEENISVFFSQSIIVKKICSGRICFGINNDNNLCAIKVHDLTEEEKSQIKDTLNYMSNQT